MLVNRTSSSDFATRTLCGVVSSLSPFTIAKTAAPSAAPAVLSGKVTTANGMALGGVIVELSGSRSGRTITNERGDYYFDDLETAAFYTVTPALSNYHFSPANLSLSLFANKTDAVFTATADTRMTANPIDLDLYFVRQHYLDFLEREPDSDGLEYWSSEIAGCGVDEACLRERRLGVSAAFFIEREFQQSGSYIYLLYKASLGRRPTFSEFSTDRGKVLGGSSLEQRREAFTTEWIARSDFKEAYPETQSAFEFVNKLYDTAGLQAYESRQQQVAAMLNEGKTRAAVLRDLIETTELRNREYNPSFVLMQYFGYLRRDPDAAGYEFWLRVLNGAGETRGYRDMVCSFITSAEYQRRFSAVITRNNTTCH